MFHTIFSVLSTVVSVYSFLCVVRIIFTWIPQLNGSGAEKFLSSICDPYLNLFKGIRWLRFGGFDFSPVLGLCILSAAAALFESFGSVGGFSISFVIQTVVGLLWNVISSVIGFVIIILAVRLVILLVNKNSYSSSPIINAIDSSIGVLAAKITRTFNNKNVSYKTQLITSLVVLILLNILGTVLISSICNLIGGLIRI